MSAAADEYMQELQVPQAAPMGLWARLVMLRGFYTARNAAQNR